MTDRRRARALLAAGLVDSFGLSFGWTAFTLVAVARGGLGAAGLYNAAMLLGIVLSAPVTAWLASRTGGRGLLVVSGGVELVLRVGCLSGLALGAPAVPLAVGVAGMNVAAWTGYAGMRAEVAAADPGAPALTRYAVAIAFIEAVGAGAAALLPITDGARVRPGLVAVVAVLYGLSVVPQFLCARSARVPRGRRSRPTPADHDALPPAPTALRMRLPAICLGGLAVTLLASGPAFLSTALAAELMGRGVVIPSAVFFSIGCLAATPCVTAFSSRGVDPRLSLPFWGIVMLAGWTVAPTGLAGLLLAQLLSGLGTTALQGDMDGVLAREAPSGRTTAVLAWAASLRAAGSAGAVRILPLLAGAATVGSFATASILLLVAAALLTGVVVRTRPQRTAARSGPVGRVGLEPTTGGL